MRIASFNLQNLRLRERDGRPVLDAARDGDMQGGPVPAPLAVADRRLTGRILRAANADIVALQEVFDRAALDFFHDRFVTEGGAEPYPHRVCLPGNDGRGLNVAVMARPAPRGVVSHASETGRSLGLAAMPEELHGGPIFRRDCLELDFGRATLFVCHFKAPYPDAERAHAVREAEARAVRAIVERRFPDPEAARWIVLGDLNEPRPGGAQGSALTPLTGGFAVDLARRAAAPDWTYEEAETHAQSRPDRILVSPRLAREFPEARVRVIHAGTGPRHAGGSDLPHGSDHALIYADFPGI